MSQFQFTYQNFKATVALEGQDTLNIRMGVRSWQVPLAQLRQFYVVEQTFVGGRELILRHGPEGQEKRVKVYADAGQDSFDQLLELLAQRCPQADIRGMDKAAALALMNTGDSLRISAFALAGLLATCVIGAGVWGRSQGHIGTMELTVAVVVGLGVAGGLLIYSLRKTTQKA